MIKDIVFGGKGTATRLGDIGLFLLRVFTGATFTVAHGLAKVQNPDMAISSARSLNLPMPEIFGWSAIMSEFLGGILLALGLLTRPAAFFIGATMVMAGFLHHGSDPFKVKELAFAYLFVMVLFICTGGGRMSVDSLIHK